MQKRVYGMRDVGVRKRRCERLRPPPELRRVERERLTQREQRRVDLELQLRGTRVNERRQVVMAVINVSGNSARRIPPSGAEHEATHEDDPDVSMVDLFAASTPYWIIILLAMVLIIWFPSIATLLPTLAF